MWHNVSEHFVTALVGGSFAGLFILLAGRKPLRWVLLMVLMLALVSSVPQIVFGYFPDLDKGWLGFAVSIGIAMLICLPFSFLMGRKTRA